jgi:hypothetical protein
MDSFGKEESMMSNSGELEMVRRGLATLVENKAARLSVVVETGYDESWLIGTADAYLRLALAAVEFVAAARAGTARLDHLGKTQCFGSGDEFSSVFAPRNVRIDGGWLVPDAEATENAVEWCDEAWGA